MIYLNRDMAQTKWCVYTVTEHGKDKPDFIWYSKISNLLSLADAVKNPDFKDNTFYLVSVVSYHDDSRSSYNAVCGWIKINGMPELNKTQRYNRRNPVRCEQTGVTYASAAEAARILGLNQSQLSQHLRRNPGYKSIRGMIFHNTSERTAPVQAARVVYP